MRCPDWFNPAYGPEWDDEFFVQPSVGVLGDGLEGLFRSVVTVEFTKRGPVREFLGFRPAEP